jgi:hypothetical protein
MLPMAALLGARLVSVADTLGRAMIAPGAAAGRSAGRAGGHAVLRVAAPALALSGLAAVTAAPRSGTSQRS